MLGAKGAFYLFFIQKFRPPFQRWRGRGAVRQRKFGFQPKLPGRKRPSSGVFSGFQPEARFARRPLSLPCGLGVGDPSPQAPPRWGKVRFLPVFYPKVSSTFSKVAGSRGSEAPEVWVPAQTSGAQAPFFGGLLGLSARSALRATPPQFALRARGRCPLPAGPTPMGQSALFTCSLSKSFVHLFKGGGVEGQSPRRAPHCEPQRSVSSATRRRRALSAR